MKKLTGLLLVICIITMMLLTSCSANLGDSYGGGSYGGSYGGGMGGSADMEGSPSAPEADGGVKGDEMSPDEIPGDETGEGDQSEEVYLPAGMITAGAWNDNDHYEDWLDLFAQAEDKNGKFFDYTNPDNSWGFNSLNRIKVHVASGDAVAGATVVAADDQGNTLFRAVTDANGNAYLFTDAKEGTITVTSGEESASAQFTAEERDITVNLNSATTKLNVIEIMLVVDVTGSMGDEIEFLKAELKDVIDRIAENDSETVIKLAMLFYRDTDDRVPFDYYDFTDVTLSKGLNSQQSALNDQRASGGGDYPEAVDEALDMAVNKQWSTGATTKIIFHVLDAPAHEGEQYATKLTNATKIAAEKGIRICPIICSGAAEATEYTMREAAIYTGGTFIFVTDDSGIGGSHHDPGLPNVTVELLNSLMVRLVNGYHTGSFSEPIYWKQDPGLNNQ